LAQFQPSISVARCRPSALVQVSLGGMILGACECSSPPPATPDRLASAISEQTLTRVVPTASSPTGLAGASEAIPEEGVAHVCGHNRQRPDGNHLVAGREPLPLIWGNPKLKRFSCVFLM
jgi:hypothetical protein